MMRKKRLQYWVLALTGAATIALTMGLFLSAVMSPREPPATAQPLMTVPAQVATDLAYPCTDEIYLSLKSRVTATIEESSQCADDADCVPVPNWGHCGGEAVNVAFSARVDSVVSAYWEEHRRLGCPRLAIKCGRVASYAKCSRNRCVMAAKPNIRQ